VWKGSNIKPNRRKRKTIKAMKIEKAKIGRGYYPNSYGRGYRPNPVVWLINGKAYCKDSYSTPYETDLEGFIMLNCFKTGNNVNFCACGLISEHKEYKPI